MSLTFIQRQKGGEGGRGGGGGKKASPTSFFPVISANVGIIPQNFSISSFSPFTTLVYLSSLHLVPVPNYWTWTKTTPQKK